MRLLDHPHLRAVFEPAPDPARLRELVVGMIGVGTPVLLGYLAGQTRLGLGIGLGAMLLGGGSRARGDLFESVMPAFAAVGAGLVLAGTRWGDGGLIALTAVAALLGGYSRPLAIASVRFCVYLVLCVGVLESAPDKVIAGAAFAIGAVWNIVLRRAIGEVTATEPPSPYTHAQRIAAFRRRLRGLAAWHYCLRLTAGLAAASIVRQVWSGHHGAWLLITVVLLTERVFERFPVKVSQRALGVTLGVVLTWAILSLTRSVTATVIVIAALAAAMPVLRAKSYLLYSAAMTPLILLVIDFGQPRNDALLLDRFIATLVGSAIVLLVNVAMDVIPTRKARPS
ncbi:FUSC family protein [uncultured Sphingomonas sp.]|uniref:FUSC family protein n=1 Tax=uncultured Sphingomonas sp. TaxID=158754 RepID=UPI0035CBBB5C